MGFWVYTTHMNTSTSSRALRVIGELLAGILGLWVLLYLLPQFSFVTEDFAEYLPIGLWVGILTPVLKSIKHLTASVFWGNLMELLSNGLAIVSLLALVTIFPFNFSVLGMGWLNSVLPVVFLAAVLGVLVDSVVNMVKLLLGD